MNIRYEGKEEEVNKTKRKEETEIWKKRKLITRGKCGKERLKNEK